MQRAQTAAGPTRPKLLQALVDAWRQPDVRQKLAFTLAMLVVFRLVAHVPIPDINKTQLENALDNNPVLGFLNLFSGSGRESAVRALQAAGLTLLSIRDVTPIPHNGCRPRKRRRA